MRFRLLLYGAAVSCLLSEQARAFGIFNNTNLSGGSRWDATPRTMAGNERSLDGGLRFSLQGGSYQSYRDIFSWQGGAPAVPAFQLAIEQAFGAWTGVDPISGLGSTLSFVADFATPVSGALSGSVRLGAEIDLFGATDGSTWNPGDGGTRGESFFNSISVAGNLKLTSGTTNYSGFAISGADITMNSNSNALYTLDTFRTILTHEVGHALGLADVDVLSGPNGTFIDDNYSSANALATLTNSFALLINPFNPSTSPLSFFTVANGNPGFDTPGVDILMETSIPSSLFGVANPLRNDDYAGRQFLYPVPEPGTSFAFLAGAFLLTSHRRRRPRADPRSDPQAR